MLGDPKLIDPDAWTSAIHEIIAAAKIVFDEHWERAKRGE